MSNFHVGQKVVCVNADAIVNGDYIHGWGKGEAPVEGRVYTVARVYIFKGRPCVWLEEIKRCIQAQMMHGPDVGYHAHRFRPVVTRKTDISIFTAMLDPAMQWVRA